jgi:translation elongation factor EF-G
MIHGVLPKKRWKVFDQQQREWTPLIFLKPHRPVVEPRGSDKDLIGATSRQAFPQMIFYHLANVLLDLFEEN